MRECADAMVSDMEALSFDYALLETSYLQLKSNVDTAIGIAKREEEKRQEKNFYRLVIPEGD
jgi:hypothetical protein